jgi:hypothetical protein
MAELFKYVISGIAAAVVGVGTIATVTKRQDLPQQVYHPQTEEHSQTVPYERYHALEQRVREIETSRTQPVPNTLAPQARGPRPLQTVGTINPSDIVVTDLGDGNTRIQVKNNLWLSTLDVHVNGNYVGGVSPHHAGGGSWGTFMYRGKINQVTVSGEGRSWSADVLDR